MSTLAQKLTGALVGVASMAGISLYSENAAAGWYNCNQIVGVYFVGQGSASTHQIQIQCASNMTTGINFVGLLTSNPNADRLVSMALGSFYAGKKFRVEYSSSATDNFCPNTTNCKLMTSFASID